MVLLLGLVSAPLVSAAGEKGDPPTSALVIEGWEVVGSKVLVKVSNLGNTKGAAVVEVRALVVGIPMRRAETVTVVGGGSTWVSVGFGLPVNGVMEGWISDADNPVL